MELQVEGQPAIRDPRETDVRVALAQLTLPAPSFLILSRLPSSYVQVALQPRERFVAEYRDRGPTGFRSDRDDFSRDEIARMLESYLAGGDAWRAGISWRPLERPRDTWNAVGRVCMVAALAVFFMAGFALKSPGRADADPMDYLGVGSVLLLTSSFIDLRRFKEMEASEKVRTISLLLVGVMIIVIYLIERVTSRA